MLDRDFAVVLLDVRMPEMSGFEIAAFIRGRRRPQCMPTIFVTAGSPTDIAVLQGYKLGGVAFLFKPIEPVILQSKVSVFVDLYHQSAEIVRQAEHIRDAERREHAAELADVRQRWEEQQFRNDVEKERELARRRQESYARLQEHGSRFSVVLAFRPSDGAAPRRTEEHQTYEST